MKMVGNITTRVFVRSGVLPWFLVISIIVFYLTTDSFLTGRNVMSVRLGSR